VRGQALPSHLGLDLENTREEKKGTSGDGAKSRDYTVTKKRSEKRGASERYSDEILRLRSGRNKAARKTRP